LLRGGMRLVTTVLEVGQPWFHLAIALRWR
jgi:hypothetical protein